MAFVWGGDLESNKDITLLASSPTTKYQIFKYQNHAYGIQFHIEIKNTTVNDWGCVPEYKSALKTHFGDGALEKFDQEAKANMKQMNNFSTILYSKFKSGLLIWSFVVGDDASKVISLLLSRSLTSYECHWSVLIFSGNVEKRVSFCLFFKKLTFIMPISAGSDFITLPPTTSPKSWHPKQKPKKGFFKSITNSFIFFFSSINHGYFS